MEFDKHSEKIFHWGREAKDIHLPRSRFDDSC